MFFLLSDGAIASIAGALGAVIGGLFVYLKGISDNKTKKELATLGSSQEVEKLKEEILIKKQQIDDLMNKMENVKKTLLSNEKRLDVANTRHAVVASQFSTLLVATKNLCKNDPTHLPIVEEIERTFNEANRNI